MPCFHSTTCGTKCFLMAFVATKILSLPAFPASAPGMLPPSSSCQYSASGCPFCCLIHYPSPAQVGCSCSPRAYRLPSLSCFPFHPLTRIIPLPSPNPLPFCSPLLVIRSSDMYASDWSFLRRSAAAVSFFSCVFIYLHAQQGVPGEGKAGGGWLAHCDHHLTTTVYRARLPLVSEEWSGEASRGGERKGRKILIDAEARALGRAAVMAGSVRCVAVRCAARCSSSGGRRHCR